MEDSTFLHSTKWIRSTVGAQLYLWRTTQDFGPELSINFNFCWASQPYPRENKQWRIWQASWKRAGKDSGVQPWFHYASTVRLNILAARLNTGLRTPLLIQTTHTVPHAWTCRDYAAPRDFKGSCKGLVSHKEERQSTISHTFSRKRLY